jgi:hypothetical protein
MTTPVTAEVPLPTYATYFDARILISAEDLSASRFDNWTRRWQFVALPPSPTKPDKLVMFYRHQENPTHRATWRSSTFREYSTMLSQYQATLSEQVTSSALASIGPPIVVGLTPSEINEYVIDRKTPWKVLERAGRQARKLGFRI